MGASASKAPILRAAAKPPFKSSAPCPSAATGAHKAMPSKANGSICAGAIAAVCAPSQAPLTTKASTTGGDSSTSTSAPMPPQRRTQAKNCRA